MLIFQEDYQAQLTKITQLKCTKRAKIQMIKALVDELKLKANVGPLEQPKKTKTIATQDTLYSDAPPVDLRQQIAELEQKIILKRDIKIELHQEIEDAEEELQGFDKAVFSKMQLDDELKRKIDFKMFEIQASSYLDKRKEPVKPSKTNKTFSSFSRKVLDFFN